MSARTLHRHFNTSRERLWAKVAGLEQTLALLETPSGEPSRLRDQCFVNLDHAVSCIDGWWGHPHLAWRFLHRVDEDLLLLLPAPDFRACAIEVRTSFDLNITEPILRAEWLGVAGGKPGRLASATDAAGPPDDTQSRQTFRTALRIVNEQVDRGFWTLSSNVLIAAWSGVLLAATLFVFACRARCSTSALYDRIGSIGVDASADFLPVLLLGALGAFASNLLTKQDFLFVRGGPHWRYFFLPVVAKPALSAFAALFVYATAKSGLLFSIGPATGDAAATTSRSLITLAVDAGEATGFTYAILAVASGFAADKVLRDMLEAVLKRLEQNAEKTAKSSESKA